MATTEDVQVQFGASIEGLTAGSYEPRDLAIYVLVWLSVAVPGEALICRAQFYSHLHHRGQKPRQGPRTADGPPLRHSKKRPPGGARRALHCKNSPTAIMSGYRQFAVRRERREQR
jgi:hypothetical protein